MNKPKDLPISGIDADDIGYNNSSNETFDSVLEARLSRRSLLRGSAASAAGALFGSLSLSACGGGGGSGREDQVAGESETLLGFNAVPKSLEDRVIVPAGYTASIIYALGDPLTAGTPAYKNDGTDTDFDRRAGDHHDGMDYFGLSATSQPAPTSSTRGLLAMNHEATSNGEGEESSAFLHANGGTNGTSRPSSEIDKEVAAHGLSVVEVAKGSSGAFAYVQSSSFNRRVTPLTPLQLSGAVKGNALVETKYSATLAQNGNDARGTINNCGAGRTPWGTLLSGEENFNNYFNRGDDTALRSTKSAAGLNRYGKFATDGSRHAWESGGATADDKYARWDITQTAAATGAGDYRNEMNTFGYMVELDPYNSTVPVKKRTSLGRFAHESGAFSRLISGKPLAVYMGDDSRGEYMYKYVSNANWMPGDANASNRIGTGDKYLDNGRLYVAKFSADGTGEWILLDFNNPLISGFAGYSFDNQADVLVHARLAADAVGATRMDRPEWCSVHPTTGEVYYTLTNNSRRRISSSTMAPDAANPRDYTDTRGADTLNGNVNGHIIRLAEAGGESAATTFKWDVYLFGAQADADLSRVNLSSLTNDQDFSSPDGLWFSPNTGLCWIQTDDGAYADITNNMMLAAIPGQVGDGSTRTIANGAGSNVSTHVGKPATADTLKRFLVGPKDAEITGIAETPDGRALFVNIQHPGETITAATVGNPASYTSHWPATQGYGPGSATTARPRSATIVITKDDGGRIGS